MFPDDDDIFLSIYFAFTALIASFIFANVRRTLREVAQRKNTQKPLLKPPTVVNFAMKSVLFSIFYGIIIFNYVGDNQASLSNVMESLTKVYCAEIQATYGKPCDKIEVARQLLTQGALQFYPSVLVANLFVGLYVFACYFYFNVQMGFAALILTLALRYLHGHDYSFFPVFMLASADAAAAFILYKFKRRLLNGFRYLFNRYLRSPIARGFEFYLICLPYFIFSIAFSLLMLNTSYNFIIQLALAHFLAYHTIFMLYRSGCDIGFDYDPW